MSQPRLMINHKIKQEEYHCIKAFSHTILFWVHSRYYCSFVGTKLITNNDEFKPVLWKAYHRLCSEKLHFLKKLKYFNVYNLNAAKNVKLEV